MKFTNWIDKNVFWIVLVCVITTTFSIGFFSNSFFLGLFIFIGFLLVIVLAHFPQNNEERKIIEERRKRGENFYGYKKIKQCN